ncbi:MAG TPA: hypothetical protein PLM63_04350 [bacterium]|nr:hypothetical protein [bacterium]
MNKKEKIKFIKDVLKEIENKVLSNINDIPEEWDELELRELIIKVTERYHTYGGVYGHSKKSRRYQVFKYVSTYKLSL